MAGEKPLAERIAALQQRNTPPHPSSRKPSELPVRHPSGQGLKDRIARFEAAGGTPVPRAGASFGLAAPVSSERKVSGGLIGNRIPSAGRYFVPRSRSVSPTAEFDAVSSRSDSPEASWSITKLDMNGSFTGTPGSDRSPTFDPPPVLERPEREYIPDNAFDGEPITPRTGVPAILLSGPPEGRADTTDVDDIPIHTSTPEHKMGQQTTSTINQGPPAAEDDLVQSMIDLDATEPEERPTAAIEGGAPLPDTPRQSDFAGISGNRRQTFAIDEDVVVAVEGSDRSADAGIEAASEAPQREIAAHVDELLPPDSGSALPGLFATPIEAVSPTAVSSAEFLTSSPDKTTDKTPRLRTSTAPPKLNGSQSSEIDPSVIASLDRHPPWLNEPSLERTASMAVPRTLPPVEQGSRKRVVRDDTSLSSSVQRSSTVPSRRVTKSMHVPKARPSLNVPTLPSLPSIFGDDDDDANYVGGWANVITTTKH